MHLPWSAKIYRAYTKLRLVIALFARGYFDLARGMRSDWMSWPRAVRLGLVLFGIGLTGLGIGLSDHQRMYTLSKGEAKLAGKSSVANKFIKHDAVGTSYNKADAIKAQNQKEVVLAAAKTNATGKQPYRATLANDHSGGMTFANASQDLSFTMVPQFSASPAQFANGRVMYPEGLNTKHVYTFKQNGVKEDIILDQAPADSVTYSWRMELGDKLEAKLLLNGDVGIYSANPYLFGDVTASDEMSQKLVDNARKKGAKDSLVFEMPAPFIVDANGKQSSQDTTFKLSGSLLSLTAKKLKSKHYPLSIDPTVVITTTADFR